MKSGKENVMIKIDKLYRATSHFNSLNGNENVTVTWYYANKRWADVNYKEIIKGYADMDLVDREDAENYINEFFAADEIELLKQFLEVDLGLGVHVSEHPIPIEAIEFDDNYKDIRLLPYSEIASSSNTTYLNEVDNYNLPFKVWGFFVPKDCPLYVELPYIPGN